MERILARDSRGETSSLDEVREARKTLTTAQLDRYWRAQRVWYTPETKQFEYEDLRD